jgi:2-polyprenyl-6-methoxyphenol hydroxylase-like FAD-dependent oxidoreductase
MSTAPTPFDVVVSGTGPAGMIASLCAAHAGLSVALVGPAINLADKRTTALLAPSLDTLETSALAKRWRRSARR